MTDGHGAHWRVASGAGDPVVLYVERQGQGPPLVLLHGFTGSGRSLAAQAAALARDFSVYRVDLIGHGLSAAPANPDCYSMTSVLAQLDALLDRLGIARAHWLAYSMGARVVLSLCAAYPARVASALLIGVSPGIEDATERAARVAADHQLARLLEEQGIEAFVEHWMALPLFASQRRLGSAHWRALRAQRLDNRATALAASLRGMGCGAMAPLHAELAGIDCPLCLVAGELDAKFSAMARVLAATLPRAELALIADAGHAAHVERPERFNTLALHFFRRMQDCCPANGRGM